MSRLREVNARMSKLQEAISTLGATHYELTRDQDANLHIKFDDGSTARLPFIPFRPYQIKLQKKMFQEKIKRVAVQRPRRSGKEVESWNLLLEAAVETPGLYLMVYPTNVRARKILWEGAAFVNGVSIPFLNMIPSRLVQSINNSDMTIKLKNGAVIWIVGSDIDPDKLRGTNPLGIVFAEYAFQDPRVLYTMLPVLRQNGGWLICQSTFDGQNHFYQMMHQNANDQNWYCQSDSIETLVDENGNRYITDEMIEEDRAAGMPEYLIQQEYYGKVQVNQETKYFAQSINHILENNRIVSGLILPNQNLYTAWDLGVNDMNCITFFQLEMRGGSYWPCIVGYLENNNKDLLYYVDECRRFASRYNLSIKSHFLPHDGRSQRVLSINNETTAMQMQRLGERVQVVERPKDKRIAIEAMRRKLHMTSFNRENTQRLIDCLSNYSKEYDDKMGTYKNSPVHNWASHGVDSYQTMTIALDSNLVGETNYEISYYA